MADMRHVIIRPSRRNACGLVLALIAVTQLSVGEVDLFAAQSNILLILSDDQGWHQLGCYGNSFYESPHLDRLAAQGMRFTNAYAAAPVCSATRSSVMTGKYPARLHLTDFIAGANPERLLNTPAWTKYLPLAELTVAEALKQRGYVTGHFGKWHLNKDKEYQAGRAMDPRSQGFDQVFTTRKPNSKANPSSDPHHVKAITDRAMQFIEQNRDRPFFCYVPHNSIHNPVLETADRIAHFAAKPGAERPMNPPAVAAMVKTLDHHCGRLLAKIDELGLADNTIVVFVSDNGGYHGRDELKPLRHGKASLYEGGIRVPWIVRWPGVVAPGTTCDEPVITNDLFPTLVAAAGGGKEEPTIDGLDLRPLLQQSGGIDREAIYFHYPHYHSAGVAPAGAVRSGRYKLIEWFEQSIDGPEAPGALQLFDLETDISEQRDLAPSRPELARQLYEKLAGWRKQVGAQMMTRNADFPGRE